MCQEQWRAAAVNLVVYSDSTTVEEWHDGRICCRVFAIRNFSAAAQFTELPVFVLIALVLTNVHQSLLSEEH